jgi:hypothetical protein
MSTHQCDVTHQPLITIACHTAHHHHSPPPPLPLGPDSLPSWLLSCHTSNAANNMQIATHTHCIDGTHSTSQVKSSKCPEFLYPVLLHVPHSHFCARANGGNGWGFGNDKSGLSVAAFGVEPMGSVVQASLSLTCPSLMSLPHNDCGECIFPMCLPKC